jgi:hypothetical protein
MHPVPLYFLYKRFYPFILVFFNLKKERTKRKKKRREEEEIKRNKKGKINYIITRDI